MPLFSLFLLFLLHVPSITNAEESLDEITHSYNGIPGCECFLHCTYETPIPQPVRSNEPWGILCSPSLGHPREPQDEVWHTFMDDMWEIQKHTGCAHSKHPPSRDIYSKKFLIDLFEYKHAHNNCLLSDYLNNCTRFYYILLEKKSHCYFVAKILAKDYPEMYGGEEYEKKIKGIDLGINKAINQLHDVKFRAIKGYRNILRSCPHDNNPANLAYVYNRGLLAMVDENYEDSIFYIKNLVNFCENNNKNDLINSDIYCSQGKIFFTVGLYKDSICSLTKAIEKDPANKELYFDRAKAYFENGDFNQAILDYLTSGRQTANKKIPPAPAAFEKAFVDGLFSGVQESFEQIGIFLSQSAQGLSRALWAQIEHPIDTTVETVRELASACYEAAEDTYQYLQNLKKEDIEDICVELRKVYEDFDKLNDAEKGHLMGQVVGKYGTDALVGGAVAKGAVGLKHAMSAKRVKEANACCNFEAMLISDVNKEQVIVAASEHAAQRSNYFKTITIEVDKQNKHIVGAHNYFEGKSIFTHQNPQGLLEKFAGKGQSSNKTTIPGYPGYQEIVDFGEIIGYDVNAVTGVKTPTTWGKIHYSKKGAHIVPFLPKER